MNTRIPYSKPSITELEVSYATDAAQNGWGDQCYAYIDQFEKLFARHLNVKHAIATSSCTGALHLGLAGLGIGLGDEVIMADTNWIATAAPVCNLGAKPVFIDILSSTWCIDPSQVEAAITTRTKAIIAVHLYGGLCEMDDLLAIGKKYNIPVVEDSAEAIGSKYRDRRAGSIGKFGCFSFHGTKTLSTGEGGMFVTDDTNLYEKVLALSNHGRFKLQSKQFWPELIGYKFKMSNIQAAIGCAQLERVESLVATKQNIFKKYYALLGNSADIQMNLELPHTVNSVWMPTVTFSAESGVTQEGIQKAFSIEDIDARVFFWPLSSLPMFSPVTGNINAWSIPTRAINLPSFHDISDSQISRVANVIKGLL
jgi:perosamine synthetase